ncbi:uncharacterized protein LACBIDRAFT_335717 [Laccaria bicolor S238N-H82]|uniref:Predicted protein n=1 Tax=Laccaria bicolor (strain S238N-H82 / ATCC MYA-4686) TaxID=486041 RepID=B0E366_LACBS|nr:uncharacterized protein LACBIDRAFT_335717 [Laccaria bicolor S238N-H82]EDQ98706.1 predicted protein [Laccaria bicolor S238N-H82]|eukprot:XP_001890634.1 predicted protein [Laccaria bicolor S238N-H82]
MSTFNTSPCQISMRRQDEPLGLYSAHELGMQSTSNTKRGPSGVAALTAPIFTPLDIKTLFAPLHQSQIWAHALRVRGTEDRNAQIANGGEPAPPADHGGADCVLMQPSKTRSRMETAGVTARVEQSLLESSAASAPTVAVPIATRKTAPTAQTTVTTAPGALDPVVTMIPEPASATKDDPPPRVTLLSLADFDNDEIEAMNQELESRDTAYRFSYLEGRYRQYHGRRPVKGPRSPADDCTMMQDDETLCWVPIPAGYTAPHTPEDYIEAVNDFCKQDHQCVAYAHPEARKAFNELNLSRHPGDPEIELEFLYNISKEEEAALVAGLEQDEAAYKFKRPWEEGFIRYTAPHDPQDYIDALNWEIAEAETTRRAELASAAQRAKCRGGEDWEAPDPMIESDLSGSDYEETWRDKETERARLRSRGKPATDMEEEDEEEDREMQRELQEEMNSKASGCSKGLAAAQSKRTSSDNKKTSPNPTISPPAGISWDALKASLSPSELDASAVLRSFNLNLMPEELIPKVDTVSSQKPSLMESALYRLFGRIVWQYAACLSHLNSRSPDFVMEKANLLQKEKRAPNRYNVFKTFASRSKPDDDDHEGLQTWNKNLNEEYRKLMEGADTSEEKDERMAEAFKFVKEQIADEGTSIRDASLRFAEHLKTITDMITTIKRRDHSFDVAGILVYSGKNRTARNKSGLFMSSPELRELCSNEQWPISTITDIFVTKVRVMHADRMIKQHMAGSYTDGASTEPSTTPSQLCQPSASSSARLAPKVLLFYIG